MTMTLIETKTLGTAAASIEFTSIPQDGTDLLLFVSSRNSADDRNAFVSFNTGGSYSRRRLVGDGSTAVSTTGTVDLQIATSTSTANTFGNASIYVPNYTGSTQKSFSTDSVNENNATLASQAIVAILWSETAAITSITISSGTGNLVTGSTISLYKITKGSDGIVTTS